MREELEAATGGSIAFVVSRKENVEKNEAVAAQQTEVPARNRRRSNLSAVRDRSAPQGTSTAEEPEVLAHD